MLPSACSSGWGAQNTVNTRVLAPPRVREGAARHGTLRFLVTPGHGAALGVCCLVSVARRPRAAVGVWLALLLFTLVFGSCHLRENRAGQMLERFEGACTPPSRLGLCCAHP